MQILTASWVLPVSSAPIREGRVAVQDGLVKWVGRRGDPDEPDAPVRDLGPGLLLPGLVNAHTHLELGALGPVDATGGFVPWVERLVARRPEVGLDEVRSCVDDQFAFRRGVVAVGDVSNRLEHLDQLVRHRMTAVVFHELLGWDPLRVADVLRDADEREARLPAGLAQQHVEVRRAAHAPHSCSEALLRALREAGGPAAIHLAESPAEVDFLARGEGEWRGFLDRRGLGHVPFTARGESPVAYLDRLGVLHDRLVAAHCVQVDDRDIETLARRGVHVVLCPTSNRTLGVGLPPLARLIAGGVRLSIGGDSVASGTGLDVLSEMQSLGRAFPDVPPSALLRMATLGGAEALGLEGSLGTLEPGKRAEVVQLATSTPPADPLETLFSWGSTLGRVAA